MDEQTTMARVDETAPAAHKAGKGVLCYVAEVHPDWKEASHEQCNGVFYDHSKASLANGGELPPTACGCTCHLTRLPIPDVVVGKMEIKPGKSGPVLQMSLVAPAVGEAFDDIMANAQAIIKQPVGVEITLRQLALPGLSGRENGARES